MIIELLDGVLGLVRDNLTYLRKVGDLPSKQVLKDNMVQLAANAPCVYGIYEGGSFGKPTATAFRQPGAPGVVLAVIAKSLRDPHGRSASRGGSSVGAYEILEDLHTCLLGKIPADGFGQLHLAGEGLYAVKSGTVVYVSTFRSSYQLKP